MFQRLTRDRSALPTLFFLTALAIALGPLLAACGGSSTATGLDDSHWNLSAMKTSAGGAAPPTPGSALTLEIGGDKLSGSAGCNTYSGTVAHSNGDNGSFTVSQVTATNKSCATPTGVMGQEQAYLAALKTASAYTIESDSLFLYDATHAPILSYVRSASLPLTSTLWRMTGYATGADALTPAPQDTSTLTVFSANGKVTGAMGSQTFNAPYKTSNDTITISTPQSAGDAAQLSAFLAALTAAKKYTITGAQLFLTGSDGRPVAAFADSAHAPPLAHTAWFLRKFDFGSGFGPVASALNVTFTLDGAGKLSGVMGCNSYQGTYATGGARIGIGDIAVAQNTRTCSFSQDAVTQEQQYPGALPLGTGFGVFGSHLLLTKIDGAPLAEYAAVFDQPALSATTWRLLAYRSAEGKPTPALEGAAVTAFFDGRGGLTGSAGCNTYQASYTTNRDALSIRTPSSTQKSCASPAGVMEQEQRYLAGLPSVATHTVAGPTLQLFTADGTVFAVYQATPPSTDVPLVGTSWYLQDFKTAQGTILGVTNPRDYTLAFAADGHLMIRADCNSGTGSYTADEGNISIKVLEMSQATCNPSSLWQQYLQALAQVPTYRQTNDTLTLNLPPKGDLRFLAQS
jgi:heat shock protein HslJ